MRTVPGWLMVLTPLVEGDAAGSTAVPVPGPYPDRMDYTPSGWSLQGRGIRVSRIPAGRPPRCRRPPAPIGDGRPGAARAAPAAPSAPRRTAPSTRGGSAD